MSKEKSMKNKDFPILLLLLMSSVTFITILTELGPSGILPEMSADLGVHESKGAMITGAYALASAIAAIPLVTMTVGMNRKKLVMRILLVIAITNTGVALASNYTLVLIFRILCGGAVGLAWPVMTAYGIRVVDEQYAGRAITVISSGAIVGLIIGLPIVTQLGRQIHWRAEFVAISIACVVIMILGYFKMPSIEGEEVTEENSPFVLFKNPAIIAVLIMTILSTTAHYASYIFIALILDYIDFGSSIALGQLVFGLGSATALGVASKFIDKKLQQVTSIYLIIGAIGIAILMSITSSLFISFIALFMWGFGYGCLSPLFQAAATRQVSTGKAIANSLQSSTFNISIMLGSAIGGMILVNSGVAMIPKISIVLIVITFVISLLSKHVYE